MSRRLALGVRQRNVSLVAFFQRNKLNGMLAYFIDSLLVNTERSVCPLFTFGWEGRSEPSRILDGISSNTWVRTGKDYVETG